MKEMRYICNKSGPHFQELHTFINFYITRLIFLTFPSKYLSFDLKKTLINKDFLQKSFKRHLSNLPYNYKIVSIVCQTSETKFKFHLFKIYANSDDRNLALFLIKLMISFFFIRRRDYNRK